MTLPLASDIVRQKVIQALFTISPIDNRHTLRPHRLWGHLRCHLRRGTVSIRRVAGKGGGISRKGLLVRDAGEYIRQQTNCPGGQFSGGAP
jgi:hypothetical protein